MALIKSTLVLTSAARWTGGGGNLFDGYIVATLIFPTGYTKAYLKGYGNIRVPSVVKIPVIDGIISTEVALLEEETTLEPPNSTWSIKWYDLNNTLVAGPTLTALDTDGITTFSPPSLTAPS